jgi:hypothetical protein
MVACERANGQWELWGLMRYDELGDMGLWCPWRRRFTRNTSPTFKKIPYCYKIIKANHTKTKHVKNKKVEDHIRFLGESVMLTPNPNCTIVLDIVITTLQVSTQPIHLNTKFL